MTVLSMKAALTFRTITFFGFFQGLILLALYRVLSSFSTFTVSFNLTFSFADRHWFLDDLLLFLLGGSLVFLVTCILGRSTFIDGC